MDVRKKTMCKREKSKAAESGGYSQASGVNQRREGRFTEVRNKACRWSGVQTNSDGRLTELCARSPDLVDALRISRHQGDNASRET